MYLGQVDWSGDSLLETARRNKTAKGPQFFFPVGAGRHVKGSQSDGVFRWFATHHVLCRWLQWAPSANLVQRMKKRKATQNSDQKTRKRHKNLQILDGLAGFRGKEPPSCCPCRPWRRLPQLCTYDGSFAWLCAGLCMVPELHGKKQIIWGSE